MNRLLRHEQYLARRRAALLDRSARERARLASEFEGVGQSLSGLERAWRIGQWARRNLVLLGISGSVLMFFKRPRKLLATAARAWGMWQSWRRFLR